ncbi:hypothetical protein HDE_06046 [Halotydeus destructor]|nr:hypothetical protein HDE_06046 [Halotydeus destructor]
MSHRHHSSLVILLSVTFGALLVSCQDNGTCSQLKAKADTCFQEALLYNRVPRQFPVNLAQMNQMVCNTINSNVQCIGNYRPCVKPFPRTLLNVVIRSIKRTLKDSVCGSDDIKGHFVDSFKCLRHGRHNIDTFFLIYDKVAAIVDHVANDSDTEVLLPNICCAVHFAIAQADPVFKQACPGHDISQMSETTLNLIRSMFDDVMDLGCGGARDFGVCKQKYGQVTRQVGRIWARTNSAHSSSPLIPLFHVLDRLDSEMTVPKK